MPSARELRAARRAAALALKELSSSLAGPPRANLLALLRRCFRFLPYLDAGDQRLADGCRLRLFDALRDVLSRDPSPSLLHAMEVFIENLVFSRGLRSFFVKRDSAAPVGSRVFTVAPPLPSEFHTVLELVCNHFISALEGEGGFRAFLSALSWSGNELQGAPEICLQETVSLINITRSFSVPSVVQAHLFLLTSRCVSGPDLGSHLSAFQDFVNLYVDYLPALGVFNRSGGVKNPRSPLAGKRPLTCCIKEVTHQKLENQVNGLLSFCKVHIGDDLPISDRDIYDVSNRLIEENQHLLHGKFRQEATLVTMNILSNVMHCAKQKEVHESGAEITEEVICLAAALRLMGSLLLQILHCFSQMRAPDNNENANHVALCRHFSNLCDTICLLTHYEANELHRCDFVSTIGEPVDRERASIQMLAHFASLSVFCVRRRLGFLWRVCIIMMMMAMHLVILEEESMDIFQLLIDASKESADIPDTDESNLPLALIPSTDNGNIQMRVYVRRSSKVIASRLRALQNCSMEKVDGQAEKVDGRAFLQSRPDYNPSSDDLVDFLECEKGKDYSNSLYQSKKFKVFKIKKHIISGRSMKKRITGDIPRLTYGEAGSYLITY